MPVRRPEGKTGKLRPQKKREERDKGQKSQLRCVVRCKAYYSTMKIESLSSSAQTAQEIKTLLQQLRKSSRHRKKQLGGSSGNVGGRINDGRDRDDAQRLDGLRKIFSRLIELRTYCGVLASSPVNISGLSRDQTTDDNSPDEKGGKGAVGMISERLLNKLLEAVVKSRQCFIRGTAVPSGRSSTRAARKDETGDEPVSSDEQLQLVSEESILTLLESEFIRPHCDVQYFVYKGLHQIVLEKKLDVP